MSQWDASTDDPEEEDNEASSSFHYGGRNALILLIDAGKHMFINDSEGDVPFATAIRCAHSIARFKIIASENDYLGVVLFGTETAENASNFKHIYVLQPLSCPSAAKIKELENMKKASSIKTFQKDFGHSQDFTLSDALWVCQMLFANSQVKLASKKVLLFTNESSPHPHSKQDQQQAIRKARDFADDEIDLDIIPMGTSFDVNKFYKELLGWEDDEPMAKGLTDYNELLKVIRRKCHKQRTAANFPFTLYPDFEIGVSMYSFCRRTKVPFSIKLHRNTNEEVKSKTTQYNGETGEPVLHAEVFKYCDLSGRRIKFTEEEFLSVTSKEQPASLKLIAMRPASKITIDNYLKPCSFIYPNESYAKGSSCVFAALLRGCLEREVLPICQLVPRKNAVPHNVALLPQAEVLDENNGSQKIPPGFHIVYLPFKEDIREVPLTTLCRADEAQVSAALQVVKKLTIGYGPEVIRNPKLQKHWRNIEALALDRDEEEEEEDDFYDDTLPDMEHVEKKLATVGLQFTEAVYPDGYTANTTAGSQKGKRATASGEPPAKRAKTVPSASDLDMNDAVRSKTVDKLTAPILKSFLQDIGKKVTGMKKQDLVEAIYQHFEGE